MYPIVWEPFGFPISSFGVMLATAFLVGTWITAARMRELGLDADQATTLLLYIMVGGIGGSKLYFAIDVAVREGGSFVSLLFAREGITWYGGLIGGIALAILATRSHGIPTRAFSECVAPALAVGQAIGRVGCFLVGDDYGRATDLPWGIAFPRGTPPTLEPVHPTQLYEVTWLLLVAAVLWRRRRSSPFLFGEYLALGAVGRFVIETWRVNPPVALGLTEPRWIAIGLFAVGTAMWIYYRRQVPVRAAA
jgi:phosphatidylglycerol:prolipoprotein diacylglycerol transferase